MGIAVSLCQYFAYIEVKTPSSFGGYPGSDSNMWTIYRKMSEVWRGFAMKKVADRKEIITVFRELFRKRAESEKV